MRTAERRVHRSNYSFLLKGGAEELIPDLMRSYYRFNSIILCLIALEGIVLGGSPEAYVQLGGLFLIAAALLLRIWTINSMGRYWTMRCMFLPNYPRIEVGPFRYFSYPEYVSRIVDILGFALLAQAKWAGMIGLFTSLWYIVRILRVEKRQLFELSFTPREAAKAYLSKLDLDRSVE